MKVCSEGHIECPARFRPAGISSAATIVASLNPVSRKVTRAVHSGLYGQDATKENRINTEV